jgi:Fe-S cluster biogenesis protein NfuA/nitrite reductase/ring-hydroxylating ferredoxin subunit
VDFDAAVRELATLVETLEREGDDRALVLLQLVDALHRPGLERLAEGDSDHPLAEALLAMYDLAPVDDRIRVEEALDDVRPYIRSHGGEVELLGVDDGVVHLRLSGACQGCAGSTMTLKRGIEEALRANYPDFKAVVAEEPAEEAGPQLLQIEDLRRPVFAGAGELPEPGEVRAVSIDEVQVVLVNVEGEPYAFKNACAVDGMSLEGARLADTVLVCPWHNCAYDARTGKREDDASQPGLAVVPVAVADGAVQVAVNVL